ncbi:hypothetical protein BGZ49_002720 [Haplosporangium sp. Z 27]|nr:hypothetical protein BGZ49_002720 [Haplosporangium sp. Z 27]
MMSLIYILVAISLSCHLIHVQSFTPVTTAFTSNVFIDSSTFYIQGGAVNFSAVTSTYSTIPQTFSIDLTVSWSINQPTFKSLPDGPIITAGSLTTAALAPNNQAWYVISTGISHTFDISSSTWNGTLSNNQFGLNPGQGAATDSDGGMIHIPTIVGNDVTGVTSLVAAHVTGESIDNVNTQSFQNVVKSFNVAWSEALRSVLIFGGLPKFSTILNQNDVINFFTPATSTWGTLNLNQSVSLPPQRTGACFVPENGGARMIVFGGLSNPAVVPLTVLGDLYIMDTANKVWIKGTSAPASEGRQGHSCAVSNNQLIVWGGWDVSYNPMTNTTLIYNLKTNTWTSGYTAPPLPTTTKGTPTNTSSSSTPTSVPTNKSIPSDSKPNTPVIAGASVGTLVVVVIGVLFVYRARRRIIIVRGFDEVPKGLDDSTNYEKGPTRTPSYKTSSSESKDKDGYWADDLYDQGKTRRSPAAVLSKILYPKDTANTDQAGRPRTPELALLTSTKRGNAQGGAYGAQRYSQHPHADVQQVNNPKFDPQETLARTRRSPPRNPQTAIEGTIPHPSDVYDQIYHERHHNPHTEVRRSLAQQLQQQHNDNFGHFNNRELNPHTDIESLSTLQPRLKPRQPQQQRQRRDNNFEYLDYHYERNPHANIDSNNSNAQIGGVVTDNILDAYFIPT